MTIDSRGRTIHDFLPAPFGISADLSALMVYYFGLRKNAKDAAQRDEDAAENVYGAMGC